MGLVEKQWDVVYRVFMVLKRLNAVGIRLDPGRIHDFIDRWSIK